MMAQVVINGLTGYLILTGNLSIGVFFSIGNFASLIFSELVVLNQNTTMIQSAKDLNNKLLVELKPVNNKENGQNNIANFAKLSIVKLQEHFSNGEVVSYNLSRHPNLAQTTDMLEKAFAKIPDNINLILHQIRAGSISISSIKRCFRIKESDKVCHAKATVLTMPVPKTSSAC